MTSILPTAADRARALIGRRYRCAAPFRVERERIREFARAVQAYHPAHWDEGAAARLGFDAVVAPPTFAALIWQQARRDILETLTTGYLLDRIVHVDQTLDIGRPLLAGDVLTCDVYVESFRHFHSFDVITVTGVLSDQHGAPVQTGSTALLAHTGSHRDAAERIPLAPPGFVTMADAAATPVRQRRHPHTRVEFDRLAVNAVLPAASATLTARDLVNYARVVGDPIEDAVADPRTAGRPALIAPGLLVLALTTGYLTSWTSDPAAVTKYRAEFANQVHYLAVPPVDGAELEFSGRVIACDRRRHTATIAVTAKSQGRNLFGYASAEVSFAATTRRG
ncbi:FAS1-like dehydratase domain-containing protein [Nocardia sp. IFM 10818]